MDIGFAVARLKAGEAITRIAWSMKGKGIYIRLQLPDENSKMTGTYIYKKEANGNIIPWTFSNEEILAEDWVVILVPTTEYRQDQFPSVY